MISNELSTLPSLFIVSLLLPLSLSMHTDHMGQLGLLHKDRCACQRQNQLINVDRAAGSDGRGAVLWSYLNSRKVFAIDA